MRLLPLLALLIAVPTAAQPGAWLPLDTSGDAIALTAHKISFDDDSFFGTDGFSALSSAQFLQARVGVTPSIRIVADLPLAYASVEDFVGEDVGGLVVGNAQVGIEADLPADRGAATVGLSVRLPIVDTIIDLDDDSGPAVFYGQFASYDRFGAFIPETATLVGTTTGRFDLSPEVALTGQLTPQVLIPTANTDFRDTEVLLGYLFRGEAQAGPALLTLGIRGTGILTEEVDEDGDRFLHALGLGAEVQAGPVRPGLFVELPINGANEDLLNAVYGFGLSYSLD
ncbi:MAG: hypothetical protein AAFQ43_10970 [Bacteroidota bacterium]